MKDTGKQRDRREPAKDAPELRFVGVEFKPAPDAQDRLRRLFTLLAGHFADKGLFRTEQDAPSETSLDVGWFVPPPSDPSPDDEGRSEE